MQSPSILSRSSGMPSVAPQPSSIRDPHFFRSSKSMVVICVDRSYLRGLVVRGSHLEFTGKSIISQFLLPFDLVKDQIPNGATLLGVVLSSDKTNISVMTGNQMAHPLLLSLANIDSDIRSKGSLHAHLLLALLPVVSFIHPKTRVRSLLADRLVHESLDFVLNPLKVATAVGIMMNDPVGNLRYCFTPLVAYIVDTPEQTLLSGTSPKALPVSTATCKQFGDPYPHPPPDGYPNSGQHQTSLYGG